LERGSDIGSQWPVILANVSASDGNQEGILSICMATYRLYKNKQCLTVQLFHVIACTMRSYFYIEYTGLFNGGISNIAPENWSNCVWNISPLYHNFRYWLLLKYKYWNDSLLTTKFVIKTANFIDKVWNDLGWLRDNFLMLAFNGIPSSRAFTIKLL
jgi:hypothetical protein